MTWHFWLIPVFLFWVFGMRRRRWDLPHHRKKKRRDERALPSSELTSEIEAQRGYISDLEARVAELENRLDFTERLLATRHQSESAAS
jgi:hypothetical protein